MAYQHGRRTIAEAPPLWILVSRLPNDACQIRSTRTPVLTARQPDVSVRGHDGDRIRDGLRRVSLIPESEHRRAGLAFHHVGRGRHGPSRAVVPFVLVHVLVSDERWLETAGDVPRVAHRPPDVVTVPGAVVGLDAKPTESIAQTLVEHEAGVVLVQGGDRRIATDLREGIGDGVES